MLAFLPPQVSTPQIALSSQIQIAHIAPPPQAKTSTIPVVPFLSQFTDIKSPQWQQVGCGITSLAMLIDFYKPATVSVNNLLQQGIAAGAYNPNAGWTYDGLIQLAKQYGLTGSYHDLSNLDTKTALSDFRNFLASGPVMLAIHNQFNPTSTVPHLVVIDGMKKNMIYYNDPAAKAGEKKISLANFLKGWKKKLIVIRPIAGSADSGLGLR
jgi:uncharacterized protein YvpB